MNYFTSFLILLFKSLFCLLFVSALSYIVYLPSFHAPFRLDDTVVITSIPLLRDFQSLQHLWAYDPSRFLTHLTFALNYNLGGLNPFTYHVCNFILHLCVGGSYYFVLKQMLFEDDLSAYTAPLRKQFVLFFSVIIFLIHPIQTASVTYVVQRATLLASLFYLLTLGFYISYLKIGRPKMYVYALITAFLGIFTKPIMFTLPLAIGLVEIYLLHPSKRNVLSVLKRIVPFILIAACVPLLLTLWRHNSLGVDQILSMTKETALYSRSEYFITQLTVLAAYLRLLFVPYPLILDYDIAVLPLLDFSVISSAIALLLLIILGVKLFKKHRLLSFGIFWFFITLSLESSIFPISDLMFEHRLYLPMVGFALIWPVFFDGVIKKSWRYVMCVVLVISAFCFLTYQRNALWSHDVKFHEHEATYSPLKERVWLNLGLAYLNNQDYDNAIKSLNKVLILDPNHMKAYHNLAVADYHKGDYTRALALINKAIALDPKYGESYGIRANIYQALQQYDAALEDYTLAVNLRENYAIGYNNRGLNFSYQGKPDLAVDDFFQALYIRPRFVEAYRNRGNAYVMSAQYKFAMEDFEHALKLKPSDPQTFNSIGVLYVYQKNESAALDQFNKALAFDEHYVDAYLNRGKVYLTSSKLQLAINDFNKAINIDPQNALAHYSRSLAYLSLEQFEEALRDAQRAKELQYPVEDDYIESIKSHLSLEIKEAL